MSRRASPHPGAPCWQDDLHHIGQALAAALRSLGDLDVTEPARLVHGSLHRGPTDTRERCDLVDRQVADVVVF